MLSLDRLRGWLAAVRKIAPERLLLGLLLAAAVGIWWAAAAILPRPLEVTALAVGDGDCYLIRTPSGSTVLLDGGSRSLPDVGARVLTPNLLLLGVHKLDAVIITHPDSDHVNGLPDVLEALPVTRLLDPDLPSDMGAFQQVLETARTKGIPRFPLRVGDRINLGKRAYLDILAPDTPFLVGTSSDTNNNCVVARLVYGKTAMLFTGDLGLEGERKLMGYKHNLRADVLTVAHHGSRFGTSAALLDAVDPAIAVISSRGDAEGDHPHASVLARLRDRGIRILRTDVNGQIRLRSDGASWRVSGYRQAAQLR